MIQEAKKRAGAAGGGRYAARRTDFDKARNTIVDRQLRDMAAWNMDNPSVLQPHHLADPHGQWVCFGCLKYW